MPEPAPRSPTPLDYQRPVRPPRNEPLGGPAARFGVGVGCAYFLSMLIVAVAEGTSDSMVSSTCAGLAGTPLLIGIYAVNFLLTALVRRATVRGTITERGRFQTYLTGGLVFGGPFLMIALAATGEHHSVTDASACSMSVSLVLASASPWVVFRATDF